MSMMFHQFLMSTWCTKHNMTLSPCYTRRRRRPRSPYSPTIFDSYTPNFFFHKQFAWRGWSSPQYMTLFVSSKKIAETSLALLPHPSKTTCQRGILDNRNLLPNSTTGSQQYFSQRSIHYPPNCQGSSWLHRSTSVAPAPLISAAILNKRSERPHCRSIRMFIVNLRFISKAFEILDNTIGYMMALNLICVLHLRMVLIYYIHGILCTFCSGIHSGLYTMTRIGDLVPPILFLSNQLYQGH